MCLPTKTISIRHLFSLSLFCCLLLAFASARAASPQTKRILVISSYDLNRPALMLFVQSMRKTITAGTAERYEFFYEFQENTRISIEKYQKPMLEYLASKYEGEEFDVVIALGGPSLKVLLNQDSVFAHTPKVFYFHDEDEETVRQIWPRATGVWAKLDIAKTLDSALALQPETRRVVVVTGNSGQDKFLKEQAQTQLRKYESSLRFEYVDDVTMDELKQKVSTLPKQTIVLYLSFFLDRQGSSFSGPEALSIFAPVSAVPVYGISDTYLGAGIVGGSLINFEELGVRTGQTVLRVLRGERPGQIPPETIPNITAFDWRELKRWQLDKRPLPPNSVVSYRTPSFWEQYKWYVLGVTAAFLIESTLIALLFFIQIRRRRAEAESKRLEEITHKAHRRLGETVANVPGIVWETQFSPATKEHKTTFINDHVETMLGYTAKEWVSASQGFGLSIMHQDDREQVQRDSQRVIDTGKDGVIQFRWKAKDGHFVWSENHLSPVTDSAGKVIGLRGVTFDITDRKHAEQQLADSHRRVTDVLESIGDAFYSVDKDFRFTYVNRKAEQLWQVRREDMLGRKFLEVFPQAAGSYAYEMCLEALRTNQPANIELLSPIINRWVDASVYPTQNGLSVYFRDINDRKQALDQLRQSEEQFEKAFRGNPQPMAITVMTTGRYLDVNDSFLAMSGFTRDEVIGRTSLELNVWATLDSRAAFINQLDTHGQVKNFEARFRTKDGSIRALLTSAELIEIGSEQCLLLAASDITERIQAQAAIKESEARFRNMADTAPVMIWVSGIDKGCTYVNQQWIDFTGRPLAEQLGNGWVESVHPVDADECFRHYETAFDDRKAFTMEYRLRRADGVYRWLIDHGAPRFSASGEFLGYVGSCVDITYRKESEAALVGAHESLETAYAEVNQLKTQLQEENIYLQEEIKLEHNFGEIIGHSDPLKQVLFKIEQVAPTDTTVLVTGETGTGKELVARAIHTASLRSDRPMVKVNCAALSASLIESELFGHEKGSFTGAIAQKIGRFELADGATIFLDEIGELSLELQVKLLRVLQEGEFERLGGTRTVKVDARVIAATNRNLSEQVKKGEFREDLWYRLNVYPITVPPLRDRRQDIPMLVEHFTHTFARKIGKKMKSILPATMNTLCGYSWPGNVRELANLIERAVIAAHDGVLQIEEQLLPPNEEAVGSGVKTLEELERDHIVRVLESQKWRVEGANGAARILGLNPSTLRTRMAKLGIVKPYQRAAGGSDHKN